MFYSDDCLVRSCRQQFLEKKPKHTYTLTGIRSQYSGIIEILNNLLQLTIMKSSKEILLKYKVNNLRAFFIKTNDYPT